jgi:DNA transposition AAA+ family ATPase
MQSILQPLYPDYFAETTVTAWMRNAINFAMMTSLAAVVRGPAGMGKSSSIAHLSGEIDGIRYFEVLQGVRSIQALLDCVSGAFERSPTPLRHMPDLLGRLRQEASYRRVCLVVDEVQRAGADGIRMLLSINEHCGIPVVLVGNNAALKRTRANEAAYDQIEDRVAKWYDLQKPIAEDIVAIARQWGVAGKDSLDALVAYGLPRTVRQVALVLRTARSGIEDGDPIDHSTLTRAIKLLGQSVQASNPILNIERGEAA